MDRITESLLKEFTATQGLQCDTSTAFEHFANYAVLYDELADTFDLDEVAVGEDGNIGIDGLAIIVNGVHVTNEQDAAAVIDANGYLDADFILIQAKTSPGFDLGDMGTFFFAVNDFFADSPKLAHSTSTRELMRLKDYIYSRSAEMSNRNPSVAMFYVSTGKWTDDPTLSNRSESAKTELKQTQLFGNVDFTAVDAERLQHLYRGTKGKSSAKFEFLWKVALPQEISGVSQAYFGVVPAKVFLGLITDDGGNIRKSLFYDNVRDFQDFNDVNKDIRATLQSPDKLLFPLLNNGVTIIASAIRPTGNIFHIEDYQIVNGCQTSHVIFHERANITEEVYVPLKIIATEDDAMVYKIIKATNFQTEVKPDELYALSDFQKNLEEFYASFDEPSRLYYERRSKQYAAAGSVHKIRVVTKQQQMRAFVAMFGGEPHRGHYPRALAAGVGKSLFGRDHQMEPYYISAFAQFRLDYFFRSKSIDAKYKPARYHLLFGARHILLPKALPSPSANEMRRYCSHIQKDIYDDATLLTAFREATIVVDSACGAQVLDRALTKTQPFSKTFEAALLTKYPSQP